MEENTTTNGTSNSPQGGDDFVHCKAELEACAKEKDEYLAGWKRAKADLINYKKEELTRAEEIVKFSNADLLRQLLEIADSFDLAVKGLAPDNGREVRIIQAQFESFLTRHGMESIMAFGNQFNPAFHEAIEEVASEKPPGVVVEEVTRGWKLQGRVIRAARVKISKGQVKI
jgi:molecular chaperone GrpE